MDWGDLLREPYEQSREDVIEVIFYSPIGPAIEAGSEIEASRFRPASKH